MNALKQALQDMLFLIDEFVPSECFENGVTCNGIDEGAVRTGEMIADARYTLFAYMSEEEKRNSPISPPSQLAYKLPTIDNQSQLTTSKDFEF